MIRNSRNRIRIRALAAALATFGLVVWVIAATLHVTAAEARDVSMGHMSDRLIGIAAGGAFVAGAIALLAAAS